MANSYKEQGSRSAAGGKPSNVGKLTDRPHGSGHASQGSLSNSKPMNYPCKSEGGMSNHGQPGTDKGYTASKMPAGDHNSPDGEYFNG